MSWLHRTANPIVVHTDGSCLANPGGNGGWAAVIIRGDDIVELSGSVEVTTNNRMEMLAAIRALQSLPSGSNVYLFTDSQYLQKGIMYWMPSWKKRGWLNLQNKPVVNKDLWLLLDVENNRHIVSWHWVRGHDGAIHNERCDKLAYEAATSCTQLQEGMA